MKTIARFAALATMLLTLSCATAPAPAKSPSWESIPPGVATALCTRLQMDAIGTEGGLSIVRTTQPFVTPTAVARLAASTRKSVGQEAVTRALTEGNRVLPLLLADGPCVWRPVDAGHRQRHGDDMTIELSAPLANPFAPGEAGIFARAVLGPQEEWFWISLASRGNSWGVRAVNVFAH